MIWFSNPRLVAEFTDWPLGGNKRGACRFHVEEGKNGTFRVGRTTTGKTKYHTYGGRAAIVDGSDGRTYILQERMGGRFIVVSRHDFKDAAEAVLGFPAAVWPDNDRFIGLKKLIDVANSPADPDPPPSAGLPQSATLSNSFIG